MSAPALCETGRPGPVATLSPCTHPAVPGRLLSVSPLLGLHWVPAFPGDAGGQLRWPGRMGGCPRAPVLPGTQPTCSKSGRCGQLSQPGCWVPSSQRVEAGLGGRLLCPPSGSAATRGEEGRHGLSPGPCGASPVPLAGPEEHVLPEGPGGLH